MTNAIIEQTAKVAHTPIVNSWPEAAVVIVGIIVAGICICAFFKAMSS